MTKSVPFSLSTLRNHSIFSASPDAEDDWELVDRPGEASVTPKKNRMAMREKDLIVAMGKEVRMTCLSGEPWVVEGDRVGSYKTLGSKHLTFAVNTIIPNPSGKLLAVVGDHQLIVIVLPRSGLVNSTGGEIPCRSFVVDDYTFSSPSNYTISQVRWHPLGESGNSLWILTSDGKLREYDVLQPSDPTQTFTFIPPAASTSKWSAVDPLSRSATSFVFGSSSGWGPLIIYGLMANGDLYALGPVLPLRSEMSFRRLQRLKAFADARLAMATSESGAGTAEERGDERAAMQSQWVQGLLRQATMRREEAAPQTPPRRISILSGKPRVESEIEKEESDGPVRLHPPHLTPSGGPAPGVHRSLLRQGPVVFSPSPPEGEEDEVASDVLVWTVNGGAESESEGSRVGVFGSDVGVLAIAWSTGRVDIALELNPVEPRWISSRDLSDEPVEVPIIESILLHTPRSISAESVPDTPAFAADPVHQDVIYVHHASGVDSISVSPWLSALREGQDDLPGSEVRRLVASAALSPRPFEGLTPFCNVFLGYGLLALTASNQLASVDLDFRLGHAVNGTDTIVQSSQAQSGPDRASLLLNQPFDYNKTLSSIRSTQASVKTTLKKVPMSSSPISIISPEHLRVIGEIIAQLQSRISAIRAASQAIEHRLDLQVQEFQRQLKLLKDCSGSINSLKSSSTLDSAEKLLETQDQLSARLDGILGALSAEHRPQITEAEKRWFGELEKLRSRVNGGGGFGLLRTRGLMNQARLLKEELEALKPSLESASGETVAIPPWKYGSKQLRPLEVALSARSEEIKRLMKRMDALSVKVEAATADAADEE